ncbi:MAG: hypothetical protein HY565_04830 [Candidatus Kerfeldbacteria bacterium]|nr:hypothetical protein [Candidatus Kerfeldbacteria bacterium]
MRPRITTKTQPQTQLLRQASLVLGIDAGATKTAAAIGDMTRLLSVGKSGPGNLHTTKPDDLIKHLQQAVTEAHSRTGAFRSVVVGMAGVDSPHDQIKAERIVKKALAKWLRPHTRLTVVNDIHIVRRSGSDDPYGIALIAGTGSHCFGMNQHGDIAYAGGLEYILADEGSGYEMGVKVLRAAVRSSDGRIKPTKLQQAVLRHFHIASVRALEPIVYHGQGLNKTKIAKLAKLVDDLAAKGDWRAKEILTESLNELTLHVAAIVQRLQLTKVPFDLVVAGGLFDIQATKFLQQFKQRIKRVAPHATVIKPQHPPVWGAVRLAQDELAA